MTTDIRLAEYLQRHTQSLTKPRQLVFEALQGSEPVTLRQLVTRCPEIDRASVYRTVALFERLGIVQRLQMGWKYKLELTDRFSRHHHHMTCLRCGAVAAFDESPALEQELRWAAANKHFKIQSHQLEIQGLCSRCRG